MSSASGRNEVYVQPFQPAGRQDAPDSSRWQVSRNGGGFPRWRADGKELFFANGVNLMGAGVEVVGDALRLATPVMFFQDLTNPTAWDVSRDGQRFLVVPPLDSDREAPITVVMNWEASLKR
jgi:hypothetical protein